MKHTIGFLIALLFLSLNLNAQTLTDAQKLYKAGNFEAAGDAYFQLYDFENAEEAYDKQIKAFTKSKKNTEAERITLLKDRAKKAARMLSRCEDIQIIDSIIIPKKSFLEAYSTSSEIGFLETNQDKVVYINPLQDKRYFAERNADSKFRLFSELKLQDQWTDKQELNIPCDSLDNINYPFVLPDGVTIYYASQGVNSIGGYDLFVSRYNLDNDTYYAPNQLGMPFNSIYNDYMVVIDEANGIGYFASDRYQTDENVIIYTFIPNETYTSLPESLEKEIFISRAQIRNIRDSWQLQEAEYAHYLQNIQMRIESEKTKSTHDFVFVINDNILYYTLDDFENAAAQKAFVRAEKLKQSIVNLEKELDDARLNYSQTNNRNTKKSLSTYILSKEKQLEEMIIQYKSAQLDARNLEIKHLRKSH